MNSEEWNDVLEAISDIWNRFTLTVEESVKALSDFFDSLYNDEIKYKQNHSPYRHKRNRCFKDQPNKLYKVERRLQKNLPYQRRNY